MATTLTTPLLILSVFFLLNSIPMPSSSCPLHHKQALLHFKSNLTGIFNPNSNSNADDFIPIVQLDSWNQDSDCCTWDHVICSTTRTVTELHLNAVIPQPINQVRVSSDILTPIFQIQSLELLDISMNSLQGQIPGDGFGNLTGLIHLDMTRNSFTGQIPSGLFNITTLKKLYLGRKGSNLTWNNKEKIVPRCSLEHISITSCGISGGIPEWISSQKDLVFLDLSGNQLEGSFPDWLAEMDHVTVIILYDNNLSGSIPPRLFSSINLSILALSQNHFSGELPENIGDARGIIILLLSGNDFSGEIPQSISSIFGLRLLNLSRNRFSGDKFPVFGNSPFHAYFDFSYNNLSGEIPTTFSIFTRLLNLGGNKFSGKVPSNLTNFTILEHLDLHGNDITGNFQDVFPQIPTLQVLNLRNNSLEGFIPRTISNLTSLRILDLSVNKLTGSIPREIANLGGMIETLPMETFQDIVQLGNSNDALQDASEFQDLIVNWKNSFRGLQCLSLNIYSLLDLSDNRISGEIPTSLGILKGLKVLNISHNNISGHVPPSFGRLEDLESLDLSYNRISGQIPRSLAKLDELTILNVRYNRLSGKIPVGRQMNTMNDLNNFANNNGLCGMQIGIRCPEDIPPPEGKDLEEDDRRQSWFLWEGTWVGFPVGFFSSILIMGYFLNFLQLFKFW